MSTHTFAYGVFVEDPMGSFQESTMGARVEAGEVLVQSLVWAYGKACKVVRRGATPAVAAQDVLETFYGVPLSSSAITAWAGPATDSDGSLKVFGSYTITISTTGTATGAFVYDVFIDPYDYRVVFGNMPGVVAAQSGTGTVVLDFSGHPGYSESATGAGSTFTWTQNSTDGTTTVLTFQGSQARTAAAAIKECAQIYINTTDLTYSGMASWEKDFTGHIVARGPGDPRFFTPSAPAGVQRSFLAGATWNAFARPQQIEIDAYFLEGDAYNVLAVDWNFDEQDTDGNATPNPTVHATPLPQANYPPGYPSNVLPFTPPPYPYYFVLPDGEHGANTVDQSVPATTIYAIFYPTLIP